MDYFHSINSKNIEMYLTEKIKIKFSNGLANE